jgi:D-2-hydroxyacid dehydrogenase (NADP+)
MKILIPQPLANDFFLSKIKKIVPEVEIFLLHSGGTLASNRSLSLKYIREFLLSIRNRYSPKADYHILDESGALYNGRKLDIQIFLHSWMVPHKVYVALLNALPNLKWIHTTFSGVEKLLKADILEHDIILTNSRGVQSTAMAEFALACMLTMAKQIPDHIHLHKKKVWESLESQEVKGSTVGIIGFGNIGKKIAELLLPFQVNIVASSGKKLKENHPGIKIIPLSQLTQLLTASDYVIITLPLTSESKNLIGEAELSLMKEGAYLINISRSEIIDEIALVKALCNGSIAGACLDAFSNEPLPKNHIFYKAPNLLLTHHSAYTSHKYWENIIQFFLQNLIRFLEGKPLRNEVNQQLGY